MLKEKLSDNNLVGSTPNLFCLNECLWMNTHCIMFVSTWSVPAEGSPSSAWSYCGRQVPRGVQRDSDSTHKHQLTDPSAALPDRMVAFDPPEFPEETLMEVNTNAPVIDLHTTHLYTWIYEALFFCLYGCTCKVHWQKQDCWFWSSILALDNHIIVLLHHSRVIWMPWVTSASP